MSIGKRLGKEACKNKPVLTISQVAYEKIWALTTGNFKNKKAYECSSFGLLRADDECYVEDIWVPTQENTESSTDPDPKDIMEWVRKNWEDEKIDPGRSAVWHHTHADLGVFWSDTDLVAIERYQSDRILWSICTNVDGHMTVRADIFKPFRFWWLDCEVVVDYPAVEGVSEWLAESQKKITNGVIPKVSVSKGLARQANRYSGYGGYSFGYSGKGAGADPVGGKDFDFWNKDGYAEYQQMAEGYRSQEKAVELPPKPEHPLIVACHVAGYLTELEADLLEKQLDNGMLREDDLVAAINVMSVFGIGYTFQSAEEGKEALVEWGEGLDLIVKAWEDTKKTDDLAGTAAKAKAEKEEKKPAKKAKA